MPARNFSFLRDYLRYILYSKDPHVIIKWFQSVNIIQSVRQCRQCAQNMTLERRNKMQNDKMNWLVYI